MACVWGMHFQRCANTLLHMKKCLFIDGMPYASIKMV